MELVFGWHLDGYRSRLREDALGKAIVGPMGLLGLLEARLGLAGIWPVHAIRVVQYQHCLEGVDDGQRFYTASFQVDPLAVATALLDWRDTWCLGGWQGDVSAQAPARLRDMAEVEQLARSTLGPGLAERIAAVVDALSDRDTGISDDFSECCTGR